MYIKGIDNKKDLRNCFDLSNSFDLLRPSGTIWTESELENAYSLLVFIHEQFSLPQVLQSEENSEVKDWRKRKTSRYRKFQPALYISHN